MPLAALATKLKRMDLGERLVRRNPLYYSTLQREVARLQTADDVTRNAWVAGRLARVLHAAARTPYGRSLGAAGSADVARSIEHWPLLQKESVRDRPEAFVRPSAWGGHWLNAQATTGGTTGVPLKLVRSPESVVAEQVYWDAALLGVGVDPRHAKLAVLRGDDIKSPSDLNPPFWLTIMGGRRLVLSSNHLSAPTLPAFVAELTKFKPDALWVYPTTLESLCLLLERAGLSVHVPVVLSSSEMLAGQTWSLAQRLLGCKLVDHYGQAERVACTHAFASDDYRFVPGYAHIELIPESSESDATFYEIVGTSLWNTAMPLVRYRTGDLIRLPRHYGARELGEIVAGRRGFAGVIGRTNDVLIDASGTQVLTGVNQIPRGVERLLRLQVVQETPRKVVLRVLPGPGFGAQDAEKLLRNARLKIPATVDVHVEIASDLQRTKAGKTPFVIHSQAVKEALRNVVVGTIAA